MDSLKVHSFESFGAHDGPGIRLVVFLQGCNLQCLYCQNADTITFDGGSEVELTEIVRRAVNMKSYFGNTGGVTVSGGEPCLQSKQVIKLFNLLRAEGIHTNVDTNATVFDKYSKELLTSVADLVMFDVKHTTDEGFKSLTQVAAHKKMLEVIHARNNAAKPFWLRYVLVPTYNDSLEDINWLIETFSNLEYLERFELIPYHKLGVHKWEGLGKEYQLHDVKENTEEELQKVEDLLSPHFKEFVRK